MNRDATLEVIKGLETDLEAIMAEVKKKKQTINALYEFMGEKPKYEDLVEVVHISKIKRAQFYQKGFVPAVRMFLEMKGDPCSVEEIYNGLKEGAFDFPWTDNQLRNVSISLTKNPTVFHRLPGELIGLTSWYPNLKKKKTEGQTDNNKPENGEESVKENVEQTEQEDK